MCLEISWLTQYILIEYVSKYMRCLLRSVQILVSALVLLLPRQLQAQAGSIVERADPFYLRRLQAILGLSGDDPRLIIARIIEVFLNVMGLLLLVMILYAGLLWMTSGGNEERRAAARKTLASAIIGTFLILASYSIVRFIISAITG